jgi:pectin methylesterase-like acyl-CoA thioesterase
MKPKLFITIISMLSLILALSGSAHAQGSTPTGGNNVPAGSSFTYQGQLKDASGPVNDSCDFQFGLWDALTGGAQIGVTLTRSSVMVSDGLFTVQLDFGFNGFKGSARWLEIAVRCPAGSGVYNTLAPRQSLTPAPYSLFSANSDTLDGQHAAAFQQHYQNLVVVAKSGGDFSTITDALNSITNNSAANPYTIYVAPGVYTETVTMKPYVDIEGAGENASKITYTGSPNANTGTVVGVSNAELRFLTVENTGGYNNAIALYNIFASPHLTRVIVAASNGTDSYGVLNVSLSAPTMTDMVISASGGSVTYGVYNESSSPTMTNLTVTASGGTNTYGVYNSYSTPAITNVTATAADGTNNYGVYNESSSPTMMNVTSTALRGTHSFGVKNSSSSPAMTNVIAVSSEGTLQNAAVFNSSSSPAMTNVTATASGGEVNMGVDNYISSPKMTNVTATASGGASNYGVFNDSSSPTIQNSVINGSNDGFHNIASSNSYTVKINNSQIYGFNSTIYQDSHYTTQVGATQLAGGGAFGGTYLCVASYNGSYTPLDSTCH